MSTRMNKEHTGQLCARLSHPACETELKHPVKAEEKRQAIQNTRQEAQTCALKNAEEFVTALAWLVEALLFQFDNLITIQVGYAEQKKEITTLIRQKQTDLLLQDKSNTLMQKGSRTWSGICYFGSNDDSSFHKQSQETATVTAAKTALGHLKTIEERDAMHEHYGQRVQEECDAQEGQLQLWHDHWQNQLKTLASLNSE
ncbi:coiled-coil domain-containing protein 180-like [Carassius carassius]|uniref:coiled-coil domain-containing protein 180-like n=1 Tax=Carassius carassius TaxID=217509 RepID=UPI00286927AA|nr:coiled-coil domain-containing protein 180-like [Carassius carassius]